MEWHPIETAPKDGTLVLLYIRPLWGHHDRSFDAAKWDVVRGEWVYDSEPHNHNTDAVWGQEWASHWAPLAPPSNV